MKKKEVRKFIKEMITELEELDTNTEDHYHNGWVMGRLSAYM